MNRRSSNLPENEKTPRWETAAMILSFALVWAYFLGFQSAKSAEQTPHLGWNLVLLGAAGVLVWVFVRRLKRILAAFNAQNKRR